MVEILLTRAFPVSAADAFAFITDPGKWHLFFPGFVRLSQAGAVRWQARGDEVTVCARTAGVGRPLFLKLEEHVPSARVRFIMRQAGFPEVEHERVFLEAGPRACRVCFVARYQPRGGLLALADRSLLAQLLAHGFRAAAVALHACLVPAADQRSLAS
jgi:hypothetical protein